MRSTSRSRWCQWVIVVGGALLALLVPQIASAVGNAAVDMGAAARSDSRSGCTRILEDPTLGLRWRWERPSGGRPGRWVAMTAQDETPGCAVSQPTGASRIATGAKAVMGISAQRAVTAVKPVIQVGDRVVVIQSQDGVLARLPGVALAAATAGSPLSVRLRIGNGGFGKAAGRVIRTRAVAHGLVQWNDAMEWSGAAGW